MEVGSVQGGFNSLFQASASLARKTVEANVPSQTEKNLSADNRSLVQENSRLEQENNDLNQKNEQLEQENTNLSQELRESESSRQQDEKQQAEEEIDTDDEMDNENPPAEFAAPDNPDNSREAAASRENSTVGVTATNVADAVSQSPETPTLTSYTANVSGVEIGSSFNSYV